MAVQIFDFKSGINYCYIIKDRGAIMIDGGSPNAGRKFIKKLKSYPLDPEEIQLIVLTHGDFDHVGSAKEIKELTGAKIAIHENDRINLEQGIFNWPKGVTIWGKISRTLFLPLLKNRMTFPTVNADIILDDHGLSLHEYGIAGKILYTPGHTPGSLSVLLDTGEAFVGCLAHNGLPFRFHPGLPIYADNINEIKESWKLILDGGANMIFPGHGKPFPVETIKKHLP